MTELHLRNYQREAIDAVFKAWADGMQRPALVLPTGAGKTVVFASLIKEFRGRHGLRVDGRGGRVIVLAHRDELVDQAIAKIRAIAPDLSVGKVKAGDNDVEADVMVCSVQTLASAERLKLLKIRQGTVAPNGTHVGGRLGYVGLIITDECHHAAAASYKKIYAAFPKALQLGVTATMARGDGVGLGKVWDDVVYSRSILWMISKGYLSDVRTKRVDLKSLDMGAVSVSRGDYAAGDLGRALMEAEADTAIARAYREHAGDRQGIVFTPTVETANFACLALNDAGVTSRTISGDTHPVDRRETYEQFRTGKVQVLVNCMVLTEGFDAPWAEVAVIARPTQSAPLYTQMVGRVLRPYPGKRDALVLDLVGASSNKLRTLIDLDPGSVQAVEEGESLAEAAVREAEAGDQKVKAGSVAFELKVREVNAFASSAMAWSRTPGGVLFIDCGDTYAFLWPATSHTGAWDVCVAERGAAWRRTQYVDLSIGEAMAWGEAVSEDYYAGFGLTRNAPWRRKPASDGQKMLASRMRLQVPAGVRAGELSDLINLAKGAKFFDKHVGKG